MRAKILVLLCLALLLSGCAAPLVAPLASEHQSPLPTQTSTPTMVSTMNPKPEPTATPTMSPSPTPEPTATSTPMRKPVKQPPELGEKKLSFSDNIETVGYVYIGVQTAQFSVKMSYQNGTWSEPYYYNLGDPPIPGRDFYRHMSETYEESYPEGCYPDEFFFESEVLHRDMVFYLYDESTCLGTGHISKKPKFRFGGDSLGITSEFQMDDPSIQLEKGKSYLALMGKWNPYPAKPIWNETGDAFEINIDGRGKIIKGRFVEKDSEDNFKNVFVQVEYQGLKSSLDMGIVCASVEQQAGKYEQYRSMINFCDYDGDGTMEMDIDEESIGGWNTATYTFAGNRPICIFTDGGE